ncbi:MAG TPA: hypothetical protein VHJ69_03095 [Gemmatimonadales bacterium]|jgi:hypothetical protein|nr:hypothetical protein [Gemmatimonadales bacterium]
MSRAPLPSAFALALTLLSFLACGGATSRETPEPAPARRIDSTPQVLIATCRYMNAPAGSMDVITGVSFALRVVTFRVHDDTEIVVRGERADLTDLVSGSVVRIEYRRTPQGNVADRIVELMDSTEMR